MTLTIAVILSAVFFGSVCFRRRFEESLPIAVMSVVLLMYIFGLLGFLRYAVPAILIFATGLLIYTVRRFLRLNTEEKAVSIRNMITPGFITFCVLSVIFLYVSYGKVADVWDEFTHWMDSVKAMVQVNDFITNPHAHAHFPHYPPAMALFQFFVQKCYLLFFRESQFCEWIVYPVYCIFSYCLFFPFLKELSFNRPIEWLFISGGIFLLPLRLFANMLVNTMIDPFLGILAGCGMAMALLYDRYDRTYACLYTSLTCIMLVIAKEAGLYLGMMVAIAYIASGIPDKNERQGIIRRTLHLVTPMMCAIISKLLWQYELKGSGIHRESASPDIVAYIRMFFIGNGEGYQQEVVDNYKKAFFSKGLSVYGGRVHISYAMAGIAILLLFFVLGKAMVRSNLSEKQSTQKVLLVIMLTFVLYLFGQGAAYLAYFSEYEAIQLASFDRYTKVIYLMSLIVLFMMSTRLLRGKWRGVPCILLSACTLAVLCPWGAMRAYVSRSYVTNSLETRQRYLDMDATLHKSCADGDKVYFVSQETTGYDYWTCRFLARPAEISDPWGGWSIGGPFYEGDVWTVKWDADEWMGYLMEHDYSHVAVYKVNDHFVDYFSMYFEDTDIVESTVYCLDKSKRALVRCQ